MGILAPLLGGLMSVIGGNQASSQANQENQAAQQQAAMQNKILNYLLQKQQSVYDPIMENQILPLLQQRVSSGPSWAGLANQLTAKLTQPMTLNY